MKALNVIARHSQAQQLISHSLNPKICLYKINWQ